MPSSRASPSAADANTSDTIGTTVGEAQIGDHRDGRLGRIVDVVGSADRRSDDESTTAPDGEQRERRDLG